MSGKKHIGASAQVAALREFFGAPQWSHTDLLALYESFSGRYIVVEEYIEQHAPGFHWFMLNRNTGTFLSLEAGEDLEAGTLVRLSPTGLRAANPVGFQPPNVVGVVVGKASEGQGCLMLTSPGAQVNMRKARFTDGESEYIDPHQAGSMLYLANHGEVTTFVPGSGCVIEAGIVVDGMPGSDTVLALFRPRFVYNMST